MEIKFTKYDFNFLEVNYHFQEKEVESKIINNLLNDDVMICKKVDWSLMVPLCIWNYLLLKRSPTITLAN